MWLHDGQLQMYRYNKTCWLTSQTHSRNIQCSNSDFHDNMLHSQSVSSPYIIGHYQIESQHWMHPRSLQKSSVNTLIRAQTQDLSNSTILYHDSFRPKWLSQQVVHKTDTKFHRWHFQKQLELARGISLSKFKPLEEIIFNHGNLSAFLKNEYERERESKEGRWEWEESPVLTCPVWSQV